VQSDLLVALGRVYDHLAEPDKGTPLLDAAVAAAKRVEPADPALLGAAISERGEVDLSSDRFDEAIPQFDQALALQKSVDPNSLDLALTLDRRAQAESQTGKHDQAIADYESALAIRQKQLAPDDPEVLNSYDAIGNAYLRAGQPERALDLMKKAVDGAAKKFGEKHVKTAHYTKNLGTAYAMQRNFVEAAPLIERAVRIEAELYPAGSPDVVNGLNNLGNIELTLGRLADARKTLEEARERNRGAGHAESLGQTFVLGNLARVLEAEGDLAGASELLTEARKTATSVVGADHARTLTLDLQGVRVDFMRDPKTAPALEKIASSIVAAPDRLAQFRPRSEPEARYALGLVEEAQGDHAKAGATWNEAVASLPADHVDPLTFPLVVALARFDVANGDADAARRLLSSYVARAEHELPARHYATGELHLALAHALGDSRKADALAEIDKAEAAFGELPPEHPSRTDARALRTALQSR
jgi:tetratricopeptide (TPR) repeat protein